MKTNYAKLYQPKTISPALIIGIVADYFDLPIQTLFDKNREKEKVLARHICMFLLHKKNMKYVGIAVTFKRDHSTVMHAIEQIKNYYDTNNRYVIESIANIENKINGQVQV